MGQHKHNPTAIAAKKGEIKPKSKRLTSAELMKMSNAALKSMGFYPYYRILSIKKRSAVK